MQTFTAPVNTSYKIQCWGASGGNSYSDGNNHNNTVYGGKGGYCSGEVTFPSDLNIYVYIGQTGENINQVQTFNGGGVGGTFYNARSGGGATDIRLAEGDTWDDFNSLKSRIIVAAGGGGAQHFWAGCSGGYAGGLSGQDGFESYYNSQQTYIIATGANQTSGGHAGYGSVSGTNGTFGYGGNHDLNSHGSGGGGGYYGGGGGGHNSGIVGSGSGGSSFISGHTGCNAISSSSTSSSIVHTGQPNHYSGYVFSNSVMIDGGSIMPSHSGGTETGHTGNGYCIITWQQLP